LSLRSKLLSVFVALAIAPPLLAGIVNYVSGTRAVEAALRARVETDAARAARAAEAVIEAHDKDLLALAGSPALRQFVNNNNAAAGTPADATHRTAGSDAGDPAKLSAAVEVEADLTAFIERDERHIEAINCFDAKGNIVLRGECVRDASGRHTRFQTENFVPGIPRPDARVWQARRGETFRSPVAQEPYGAALQLTVPIAAREESASPSGALVAGLRLAEVFGQDNEPEPPAAAGSGAHTTPRGIALALDNRADGIIYHTSDALKHQLASEAMPFFDAVASKMRAGEDGFAYFDAPDGDRWVTAYKQLKGANVSVAAAENYTAATAGVRRTAVFALALPLLAGVAAVLLLALFARRASRQIGRVAAGAAAIAGGHLDQRIEVEPGDETQALAESFNLMSDRLSELIAREAESKQFESFMRLSAMLTHDLKNAITGLSMLVSNMDKHLHREEFRADAISSLREATDKLRRIVSRLNEPVKSLSGEYRRDARATDLVPIFKRVVAANAEPAAPLYEIEMRVPDSLVVTAEPDRIENVVENLVINALEAMGARGGRLGVEAGAEGEGRVFFSVSDTGPGMSEEFIATRLYRPFTTTKSKGIGLGLFTCREIVEAHGGRLEVESRPGVGTRFRVVLPSGLFTPRDSGRHTPKGKPADKP
jgi:signal transduction histidine kinase